jgi:glycosyltransferase involved in cell wall biosynthesis
MSRIKVLWLSNALFEKTDRGVTGTWLHAMSEGLIASGRIELGNITSGKVTGLVRSDHGEIKQWVVPLVRSTNRDGLPEGKIVNYYLAAIKEFDPDLIHIWGIESYPALITSRNSTKAPKLLEIQGIAGACAKFVDGGLSVGEMIKCIGLKEIILRSSVFQIRGSLKRWGRFEEEMIANHKFITAPSKWMQANVKVINPEAFLFQNEIPLRKEFFLSKRWKFSGLPVIFCSASSPSPYKGFHVIIRSLKLLKQNFPHIQLRIAGAHQLNGIRKNGYINWLNKLIKANGLESNVTWLGSLHSDQVIQELLNSSVMALPSYIESYGVAHAEAMALGIPCVCAFNGGSSYLAEDEKTALFFQPGDHVICANQISRLLLNEELAKSISSMAREKAMVRNNTNTIINNQIQIYEEVLIKSKQGVI